MSGKIAFKIYGHEGIHIGYIGYKFEDGTWFFPKGFKRPLYNAHRVITKEFVIVTTHPFDALRIISLGNNEVVCLLANSMTSEQEEQLKCYRKILLLHKEPQNIVNRLSATSFIKAPVLLKKIEEMTEQEVMNIIKPFI